MGLQTCIEGYYYNYHKNDDEGCVECDEEEAICKEHTTIASIVVLQGYYRFSRSDPTIYPCPRENLCLESISNISDAYNCGCVLSL